MNLDAYILLAQSSIRRLWPLRNSPGDALFVRKPLKQWISCLRQLKKIDAGLPNHHERTF